MANSILSSAAFSTANMKPIADEQIDALWGDNISDNSGFLYYQKKVGPEVDFLGFHGQGGVFNLNHAGTKYFTNYKRYGTFSGSFVLCGSATTYGGQTATFWASFYVNGVLVKGTKLGIANGAAAFLKGSFSVDTTGLTDATDYEFSWTFLNDPSTSNVVQVQNQVTTWQHRT